MDLSLPIATGQSGASYVAKLGGYPYEKKIECAGRSLHRRRRNLTKGRTASQDSIEGVDEKALLKKKEEKILRRYRKSIRGKDFLNLTMYQQLGLTDVGFDASDSDIRKAYHRVLIEHHPDKTGKTENDPNYLAVQKAFNTLMDPQKKRAYDSQCDFDDSIPSGKEGIKQMDMKDTGGSGLGKGVCFYELYRPVFERNARFSENNPVPALGDESTSVDDVYRFYDFWVKFDSWRDFSHDAEHDVDGAEHRGEKRYLQKKNENAIKKKKKQEYARLTLLVDRAMANDPRLKRVKFAAKEKKRLEKQAKEDQAQALLDAAQAKMEAEQKAAADEEMTRKENAKKAKFEKEKLKKVIRKAKKQFRELMSACRDANMDGALNVEATENVCDNADLPTLQRYILYYLFSHVLNCSLSNALGSADAPKAAGIAKANEFLSSL